MVSTRTEFASPNPPSERAGPSQAVPPQRQLGPPRRLEGLSLGLRILLGLVTFAPLVLAAWAAIEASSRMGAEGSRARIIHDLRLRPRNLASGRVFGQNLSSEGAHPASGQNLPEDAAPSGVTTSLRALA